MMKFLALRKVTSPRLKEQPILNFFFQRAAGKPGTLFKSVIKLIIVKRRGPGTSFKGKDVFFPNKR